MFCDIELAHDLNARNDSGAKTLLWFYDLLQNAVNTHADPHKTFPGLNENIARAAAHSLHDQHIDKFHDRRLVGLFHKVRNLLLLIKDLLEGQEVVEEQYLRVEAVAVVALVLLV